MNFNKIDEEYNRILAQVTEDNNKLFNTLDVKDIDVSSSDFLKVT